MECTAQHIEDVGPDYSADVPDLSNMAEVGTFGYLPGLTPYSSDGKEVQEGERDCRIQNTETSSKVQNEEEEYRTPKANLEKIRRKKLKFFP